MTHLADFLLSILRFKFETLHRVAACVGRVQFIHIQTS